VAAGLRAEVHHDGSVGARVRAAAEQKIPYVGIVGKREAADNLVALRLREGRQLPARPAAEAIALIASAAAESQAGADVRARP